MLKALLFDLDGTLADTDPIHFQTWQDILRNYGLEIDRTFYKSRVSGRLNSQITAELLAHLSLNEQQELSDYKEAEFRRRAMGELEPLPGVLEMLEWADRQQLKKALVTNAPVVNAEFMLTVLNLSDRFDSIILAEELERGKPDPLPYQVGLQQLGVTADSAIAFEDSPSGVKSAIGAGIPTIGLSTTHTEAELRHLGVTFAIPNFADVQLHHFLRSSLAQVTLPLA